MSESSITMLLLPSVTADEFTVWPEEEWGVVSTSGETSDGMCGFTQVRVPEGLLYHGHCRHCGGSYDTVIDLNHLDPVISTAEFADLAAARFASLQQWLTDHLDCAVEPKKFRVPDDLQQTIDGAVADARATLERGESLAPALVLLLAEGLVRLPLDFPDASTESGAEQRRVDGQRLLASLRRFLAARNLDLRAACLVSEVWIAIIDPNNDDPDVSPSQRADRGEGLLVVGLTGDFGVQSIMRLERGHDGAVSLDAPEWKAYGGSRLLDGLFATNIRSLDDDERFYGGGVFIEAGE